MGLHLGLIERSRMRSHVCPPAELIAEGDCVVGQWIGGSTQTVAGFDDMPIGALPAGTGKTTRFTGTTVLKVKSGLITEEIGLDDGVTVLQQLGLITAE